MGKAKVCSQPPTHSYGLRNREALKAKKTATMPVPPVPVKKRNKQGNEGNKKVVHDNDNAASSAQNDIKERKVRRAKRVVTIRDVPIPPPEAQRAASDERVYASLQERIPLGRMQDLKGMDDILDDLKAQVIWPFANVKNARILNLDVPRGVLLTGVPGTGKTALADAIVNEMDANGRKVSYYHEAGACLCKWVGESEGMLRSLFQTAKDNAPSVIFLDEIDGLGMKRSGDRGNSIHTILTTLLTELNNLPHGEVLVIAATNCPQLCDAALIRKGRFDLTYNLPLPSPPAREEILRFYFQEKKLELDEPTMDEIVERTEGQTGCDLKALVASIYSSMITRQLPGGMWVRMTKRELLKRMEDLNLDVDSDVRPKLGASEATGSDSEE